MPSCISFVCMCKIQMKYPESDTDAILPVPSFGHQIRTDEFEHQKTNCRQEPLANLLEEITMNMKMSIKEKKKKLKQVNEIVEFFYSFFFIFAETFQ